MSDRDPITLELIQSSLQAAADEMFAAMRRTAMSSIIYEVLDMGTGITDARGRIASSGAGIPSFVGVLDKAVQRVLELRGADTLRPGDVYVTNDPYYGGVTHLNDIVLAMPVFAEDTLVAWTATIAHFSDVGGMAPGSISTDATEIFQEGLRLPAVKLIDAGAPIEPVLSIMKANTRLPDYLEGDLWASVAAVRIGARRIEGLVGRYGTATVLDALDHFMDYGEQVARAGLRELPAGRYELSEDQDDGRVFHVAVEIDAERFVVDLRDNPDQDTGPANCARDGALIAGQMIFKALTDPHGAANEGSFRPLEVLTRPGSVFDAQEPAAFGVYYEVEVRLADIVWRCLADAMGDRLPAGHFASICGTFISGVHPDSGRSYTIVEPQVGGWGGSAGRDGNSAIFSAFHGETFNCPAEIAESRYGLFVDRLALDDAPGGEGRHRGGRGICLEYRVRADGTLLTCAYTRNVHPAWGLDGGRDGSPNVIEVVRADGREESHAVVTGLRLDAGDVIRIRTGHGGGHGDPRERDPEAVRAEVRAGLVSPERARDVYGVD